MTHSSPGLRIVLSDLGDSLYWTWAWDGEKPRVEVIGPERAARVRELLDEALPGRVRPAVSQADLDEVPVEMRNLSGLTADGKDVIVDEALDGHAASAGRRADLIVARQSMALAVHRCLTGPLSSPARSQDWADELALALLPRTLVTELTDKGSGSKHLDIMIMPSGSCAAVPWEILPIGGGRVLLDVANVAHFAPMTQRDFGGTPPNRWGTGGNTHPLWVIDPRTNGRSAWHVLDDATRGDWEALCARREGTARIGVDYDRIELSNDLLGNAKHPSLVSAVGRFFFLGHVISDGLESTALLLGCGESVYSVTPKGRKPRGFSARDALLGTIDFDADDQTRSDRFPPAALDSDGQPTEVPGSQLWPMPARVALIACGSGVDFRYPEPFGLVTAFFEAGAELITATRWTLLTDRAFACYAEPSDGRRPLHEAALVVDSAHAGERPLADIATWQREMLERWRLGGRIADSPLTWASLATHLWRPRANPVPQGLAGLIDERAQHG